MAAGYGIAKTALPAIGATNPTAMAGVLSSIQECMDTLGAKVTNSGIDLSAVPEASHGTRQVQIDASRAHSSTATWTAPNGAAGDFWQAAGASDVVTFDLGLAVGQQLSGLAVRIFGANAGGVAWTAKLWKRQLASNTGTQLGNTATSGTGGFLESKDITISPTPEVVADGYSYYIAWTSGAAVAKVYGLEVFFTRP
jgi:hypothetical protein